MVEIAGKNERMWAMLCHLSSFVGYVIPLFVGYAIPFANIFGPLVIWLIKRENGPLVDHQGKESLNFQISMTIYYIVSFFLVFVGIGIILLPLLALFGLIMVIIAAVKANSGTYYRYPLTIRFFDTKLPAV